MKKKEVLLLILLSELLSGDAQTHGADVDINSNDPEIDLHSEIPEDLSAEIEGISSLGGAIEISLEDGYIYKISIEQIKSPLDGVELFNDLTRMYEEDDQT